MEQIFKIGDRVRAKKTLRPCDAHVAGYKGLVVEVESLTCILVNFAGITTGHDGDEHLPKGTYSAWWMDSVDLELEKTIAAIIGTVVSHFEVKSGHYTRIRVDGQKNAALLRFVDMPRNSLALGTRVNITVEPVKAVTVEILENGKDLA